MTALTGQARVPFGAAALEFVDASLACETCEELALYPLSTELEENSAIIVHTVVYYRHPDVTNYVVGQVHSHV